ncbi:MAG: hypothetical protein SGI92_11455 [Bryobacteraceae bacterium]|nr:hypothetical protein [Bryobacteraceae bacterium]
MVTTPVAISKAVLDFCREVCPTARPVYLQVRPFRGAKALDAFENVDRFTSLSGGKQQTGWIIWEWPDAFIEAEHHAVVRLSDNTLREVSPHDEMRVLFLPDDAATFDLSHDTYARPSIRKATSTDLVVAQYLANFEARDTFIRTKMNLGINILSKEDTDEIMRIENESWSLSAELFKRHLGFVSQKPAA